MIILDLCGGTGSWSKPYKDAGFTVHVLTLPEYDIKKAYHYKEKDVDMWCFPHSNSEDEITLPMKDVYGIFAAPPCTMFSRARTTAKTPRDFRGAMKTVEACLEVVWQTQYKSPYTLKFWALENPAGHLQRFLGKPPFRFHPYDFGDRHSKETFIWGMFNEPKKKPIKLNDAELLASRNNTRKLPEIPEHYVRDTSMKSVQVRRSITPQGFAQAFFKANSKQGILPTPKKEKI
jgi:hypothetical protein